MSDIRLFEISGGITTPIPATAAVLEKHIQNLIERNLSSLLSISFLASEHSTGAAHGGRIDSLGLDENFSPVIIEYKRNKSQNVINQGLFYLDWLMDHRAEFQLLVQQALGPEQATAIDWSGPRLLCIAEDFTRYDEHAVKQMDRNIELLRYRKYGNALLLLELVNSAASPITHNSGSTSGAGGDRTVDQIIHENVGTPIGDIYDELRSRILDLGDDIQEKHLKLYVAFKRLSNFVTLVVQKKQIHVYVKVDPGSIELEEGFTRDVRKIGHFGTGDLQIVISTAAGLDKAWHLIEESYETA